MSGRPRLVVLSHVLPFPRNAGQQQRVFYTLRAAREAFHTTFLTTVRKGGEERMAKELAEHCDASILLPSLYAQGALKQAWHQALSVLHAWRHGLKRSNYIIGELEFHPSRIAAVLARHQFDCALFEYWHAVKAVPRFRAQDVPCVLDMHNILWQSFARQMRAKPFLPARWKERALAQYKAHEEKSWRQFDALIAINGAEYDYTKTRVPDELPVYYAPMGTDTEAWPYSWEPAHPTRLAYYGGLGSPHNQKDALTCYESIMPAIWQQRPETELWLVGSNPPPQIQALAKDPRVKVTGYVQNAAQVLKTMTALICPWIGTYGFRSRLIEVMSLGVPVVTTPDAVYGMRMERGGGIFLESSHEQMARICLELIRNTGFAKEQSLRARRQVEEKFSFDATYGRLRDDLLQFTLRRGHTASRNGEMSLAI